MRATWYTEDFAELGTAHATLAIGSTRTVPLFAPGAARPADNRTVIIEFLVEDVDGVHQNLAGFVEDFVQEPTTMPWGNRSLLFRDPDGKRSSGSHGRRHPALKVRRGDICVGERGKTMVAHGERQRLQADHAARLVGRVARLRPALHQQPGLPPV